MGMYIIKKVFEVNYNTLLNIVGRRHRSNLFVFLELSWAICLGSIIHELISNKIQMIELEGEYFYIFILEIVKVRNKALSKSFFHG